jgi:hypothetical protein
MRLLQCLGKGRCIYWRCLGRSLVGSALPVIEQFKIETVELTRTQKITTVENYYFDVSALSQRWEPIGCAMQVPHLDFRIPHEIGWLHAGEITDNESATPGAGVTVPYGAPAVKATIYIYDWQRTDVPEDVKDPIVRAEFEQAIQNVHTVTPHIEAWADPAFDGRHLFRCFKIGDDAKQNTLVALTTYRRKFIKLRTTWERDGFVDAVVMDWVHSVLNWCSRSPVRH